MPEVPVIVEKGLSETDGALYYFVENAHRRRLTPKQTALAIAQAYETLTNNDGSKMTIKEAKQILSSLWNINMGIKYNRINIDKIGSAGGKFTKRPKDFDYVLNKIGYKPNTQQKSFPC